MAWSFSDEIHSLAGYDADSTSTSTSGETLVVHTNQWLTDGAREVINNLPINLQKLCTDMITFTSAAAGSEAETLNTGKIFNVFAGSVNCRLIANADKYRASDSGDVLYATSTDPAYYIESNYINVLPASLSCKYEEVQYPTVANTDSSILVFPDEAEHLVVLYAAIKACLYQMNTFQTDTTIDTDALDAINTNVDNAVTEIGLANGIIDSSPVPPDVPTLTSITFASIDSVLDAALPTYTTATVSAGGVYGANTAPAYTKPVFTSTSAFLTEMEAGTIGHADSDIDVEHWFSIAGQLIEDNEDIELASAHLQKITTFLNAYQADMQNELNEFNKENVSFQANIQEGLQELQVANQVNIAKAQGELQKNISNEDRDQQRQLQNGINDMQAIVQNNQSLISKYTAEISEYQAEVGEMSARSQGYISTANTYIASANAYAAEANTRIARANQKYAWYDAQYAKLTAEYTRGLAALKGGEAIPSDGGS